MDKFTKRKKALPAGSVCPLSFKWVPTSARGYLLVETFYLHHVSLLLSFIWVPTSSRSDTDW